ncbi:DUF4003 family protein [Sporosarcina thermotolerans]|uniref:DUF4003 family protein n=1 Tax=Sporosarcina thermotolerans TaxID=633404 RepID=UPI0024BC936F|nr:DUF4003 family protein [Sporosarcina thermotolerans]WHT48818.1 DUF4003 family protein [Sporosarcina thermotolerans]
MLGDDLKVKPIHYPMIGFLTVFDVGDQKISEVISITNELERSKQFKWNREMALSLACGIMLHHLTESANQVGVSMATSFEMVLQAQQAVMAVTVAGSHFLSYKFLGCMNWMNM